MAGKILTREEIEKKAIEKAWKDESFKKDLMQKPHKALSQLGVNVPEKIEIKVVEESAKVVYLVLPVNPETLTGELTDENLENVAGGWCKNFSIDI
ncbi:MAG: NHLP leader peptide family RiPP precursor [Desulfocucumaceae bacterium]